MSRTAAAKANAAADDVLRWLQDQSRPALPIITAASTADPTIAQSENGPDQPDPAGQCPDPATLSSPLSVISARKIRPDHTDWLQHRLTVGGPAAEMTAFRTAAAGAGIVPWVLDTDRMAEDLFHLLVSPPPPQQRQLSIKGARIFAKQLRDAVVHRQTLAVARIGHSCACPLDLHALLPVPPDVLARGPDDPLSLAWLWEHWGTTQALRHVEVEATSAALRTQKPDEAVFTIRFWSADWTPWRALQNCVARWPALRFETRPVYDPL
jgi:hypothetical protein